MKKTSLVLGILTLVFLGACSAKPTPPPPPAPAPVTEASETPPPPLGIPHEALVACEGKKAKAKCMFQTPRKDVIRGTCHKTPAGSELECRPRHPKRK